MFSSAEKTSKPAIAVQQKAGNTSFFKKAGEDSFFGSKENLIFFNAPVQAKLTVSHPDDPQEKEADAVAEKVMRMEEPIMAAPIPDKKDEKLQKQEEEKDTVQTKPLLPSAPLIQRKEAPGQKLQAKLAPAIQILARKAAVPQNTLGQNSDAALLINRKCSSVFHSDVVQRSGRGSPSSAVPFDKALAASKGGGTAMSGATKQFMESRFQADFSGVRIHTGPAAEHLSSSIQAQAFAHGNDIYFNQNKYSPDSSAGRTLLAHELTHTIQQGASRSSVAPTRGSPPVALQKNTICPSVNKIPLPLKLMPVTKKLEKGQNNPAEIKENHYKEDTELKKKSLPENKLVQPKIKSELGTWSVSPKGQLQPAVNTAIPAVNLVPAIKTRAQATGRKTINAKEPLPEENSREKERIPESSPATLQKTPIADNPPSITTPGVYQSKYNYLAASPNSAQSTHASNINLLNRSVPEVNLTPRGPPLVQQNSASGKGVVQCALYDDALARISSLLELPSVTEILDFDPIAWLRGKVRQFASYIPGYRALGVILGADPITGEEITRNGRNFLEAGLDIIPGGNLLKQKLDQLGILDRAAGWIDTQIDTVRGIVRGVTTEFNDAWNALTASSILDGPTAIVRRFGDILERGLNNIIDFARRAGSELLKIVKDFLLSHIVTFVKEHTTAYELLKVILEQDPITEEPVARNGTNILNALLELGGEEGREQRRQMQETGTFQKAADHIDRGIAVFSGLYNTIRSGFDSIWSEISIESLMNPVDTFNRIYAKFEAPVQQVLAFVEDTLRIILGFIKEALMGRLSAWAGTIRGYRLVTVIIGKDPFTNATVPRTVENIIRGFMSLMEGGEEQFNQLQESGAIGRAVQRINAAVARLNMTPEYVVQLFTQLWNSFSFADLADPMAAFQRIMDQFGEPIGRLVAFVVEIVRIVVEVVMQVMQFPSDLIANIISRAMQAFEMIKQDPVGFLKNLLRAIKQGFIQFFENIGQHLLGGLQGWLMSELGDAGVQAPQDFTLRGIITWVLDLLGITMEKIWEKLAQHRRVGPERVARIRGMINQLEGIWTFIKDVQERGMAAIWEKIQERLSSLWDTILDAVKNWVMEQIVNRITARLLTMLDPTGIMAVINGAIALYSAVQSFIRYLREMLQIVNSFVEGVVQIASGDVSVAANFLERAMARGVPIMIGFLANQVGLSGLGRRIGEMIGRVREMVDEAITWLVNRAVDTGMALLDRVMGRGAPQPGQANNTNDEVTRITKPFSMDGEGHSLSVVHRGDRYEVHMASNFRERLIHKIDNAKTEIVNKTGNEWTLIKNILETERGNLVDLEHDITAIMINHHEQNLTISDINNKMETIANNLQSLGNSFHIKSLQNLGPVSKYVTPTFDINIAHPELAGLSLGDAIRRKFYGGWRANVESWKNQRLGGTYGINVSTSFGSYLGMKHIKNGTTYFISDLDSQEISPNDSDIVNGSRRNLLAPNRASIDHYPPVASNWNTHGRNTNQNERQNWFNNVTSSTHKIISTELNSALGSRQIFYESQTGTDFRGPGE